MITEKHKKLLENREVVEEINRHLWIESEKAGYDIGFDQAAADWLVNFSDAWLSYHQPKSSAKSRKPTAQTKRSRKKSK